MERKLCYDIRMEKREFSYKIEYEIDKETAQVVATIPELNHVSSFGDSFAEVEANVREAASGYVEVLLKRHQDVPKPEVDWKSFFREQAVALKKDVLEQA